MLIFKTQDSQDKYLLEVHRFVEDFHQDPTSFLAAEELQYFHQIANQKRKLEYLQSRFVLKSLLAKKTAQLPKDIRFDKIAEGKPVLAERKSPLDFNLSHSHECFVIALSEQGQVGVDIEKIRPPQHLQNIAQKFFSPQEALFIEQERDANKQAEVFSRFWSGKEALIKTVGGGVFKNVRDIEIEAPSWKIKKLPRDFGSSSSWRLDFFQDVPGYMCAVAFKKNDI